MTTDDGDDRRRRAKRYWPIGGPVITLTLSTPNLPKLNQPFSITWSSYPPNFTNRQTDKQKVVKTVPLPKVHVIIIVNTGCVALSCGILRYVSAKTTRGTAMQHIQCGWTFPLHVSINITSFVSDVGCVFVWLRVSGAWSRVALCLACRVPGTSCGVCILYGMLFRYRLSATCINWASCVVAFKPFSPVCQCLF